MNFDKEVQQLFEGLGQTTLKALNAAYERGVKDGIQQERSRVLQAISPAAVVTATTEPKANGTARPEQPPQQYGAIAALMRKMLRADREMQHSVSSAIQYIKGNFDVVIAPDQIRTGFKVLASRGEAERVERGWYRAGPKLSAELPIPASKTETETAVAH